MMQMQVPQETYGQSDALRLNPSSIFCHSLEHRFLIEDFASEGICGHVWTHFWL